MKNVDKSQYSRLINTYLKSSNRKYQEIISSVYGQLSDGKWENSPSMEKYWRQTDKIDDIDGYIYIGISNKQYDPFYGKSDKEVKAWFADKAKLLVKDEIGKWGRELQDELAYFGYDEKIRACDVYEAYDILKERVGHDYGETAQHTKDVKEGRKASIAIFKQIKDFKENGMVGLKTFEHALRMFIDTEPFNSLPEAQKNALKEIQKESKDLIDSINRNVA